MRQISHIKYLLDLIFWYFRGCNSLGPGDIPKYAIYIFEDPHIEALEDLNLPYFYLITTEGTFLLSIYHV